MPLQNGAITMTVLGLDFDNTLVRYDELFHKVALNKGLIKGDLPVNKMTIRDYLRKKGKMKNSHYCKVKYTD